MANPVIKMHSKGARALLTSDGVRDYLTALAQRVKARQGEGAHIWQDTTDRAAVRIGSTDRGALRREADTGYLSASLDAAGGGA